MNSKKIDLALSISIDDFLKEIKMRELTLISETDIY